MEENNIRNYIELTNNGEQPSAKYIEKVMTIRTEEDKDACLRFLTFNTNNSNLCHGYYDDKHINSIIEYSDTLIYFYSKNTHTDVIAFALLRSRSKKKGRILDIQLVCAIPNKSRFGKMIAHAVYKFAIKHSYPFLYVSPRTPELRATFMKYGFEPVHGIEGINEVLEKEIELIIPVLYKRGKTQKRVRDIIRDAELENNNLVEGR